MGFSFQRKGSEEVSMLPSPAVFSVSFLLECPEMIRFRSDFKCDLNLQRIFAVDQCLSTWASQIKFIGLNISLLVDTLRQ